MADWKAVEERGYQAHDEDSKINALQGFLENQPPESIYFAVAVIGDVSETWIVRAEACRFIRDVEFSDWEQTRLCEVVTAILVDPNEDFTLQQWAAFLVNKCLSSEKLVDVAIRYLSKSGNREEVTWNIIESLDEADTISDSLRSKLENAFLLQTDERIKAGLRKVLG
ncbi:hypothetical protein [Deinococcus apachensis]|uniref:hypothetical protein n=1 Tax=Deinococcus apachensis TaxID=309886 RepID=UPI0012FA7001|nr:hypothetical protein [Deinococcus apachensis]